jgi:hypothetical protein
VGLVAFQALGNISMVCMMTGRAIKLRMQGYICLYLTVRLGVAYVAALIQFTPGRDFQRRVDLPVTCATLRQLRTVDLLVTCLASGKDFFVWRSAGTIDMELHMASLAVYPMFAASVFQEVINAGMTLPALFRFHGYNFHVVVKGSTFFSARLGRNRRSTPDKIKTQAEHREYRYYVSFEIHYLFGPRQMYFSISPATI